MSILYIISYLSIGLLFGTIVHLIDRPTVDNGAVGGLIACVFFWPPLLLLGSIFGVWTGLAWVACKYIELLDRRKE